MAGDTGTQARLTRLVEQLRAAPGFEEGLPSEERDMVTRALDGARVSEIASAHGVSEAAVWTTLSNAARFASGHAPSHAIETGGLGSDTDAGVSGGYGDTGFGSIGNDPPEPWTEEPAEDDPEARG